jgi:hypothetical protein
MRTTIQVEKKTLDRLKKIKITKRETYDEILNRLIDNNKEGGKQNASKNKK